MTLMARGSGSTLFGIAERTTSLLAGDGSPMRAESVGVPYPANAWLYFRSRNIGAKNLTELLTEDLADCPDHLIVLLGLSQGAEVIRRTLATQSHGHRQEDLRCGSAR